MSVEGDGLIILFDDYSKLKVGYIGFNVEGLIVIGVDEHCISLDQRFHLMKGFIMDTFPRKYF